MKFISVLWKKKKNKESGDFCADLVEFQNEMTHEKAVFAHW